MEVWTGIRHAVKSENPQAYLLGENFFDGTSQLQGDQLDATMNYAGFTNPVLYWLAHFQVNQHGEPKQVKSKVPWPTEALTATWQAQRAAIPWVIACQQFNLLDSHDTPRIDHIVDGDPARKRLAVALLFTYPGVPSVYYGDEIGMTGQDALEARNCMTWDSNKWDQDLRSFYQQLIRLRRTSPALIDGGFQILTCEENVLGFLRDTDAEQILVIGNRGPSQYSAKEFFIRDGGIPDGTIFTEIFSGQTLTVQHGYLSLPVVPVGVQIWRSVG
jgi:alpha-glucosidase